MNPYITTLWSVLLTTFSVVIAAYNASQTLARAIDSALSQSLKPHEIICVNDGSTDGTGLVLEQYSGLIKVITQRNQGVSGAKSVAGRHCTGEWVVFLDADDEWLPHRLERIADCVERRDLSIVTTDAVVRRPGRPDTHFYDRVRWVDDDQKTGIIQANFIFAGAAVKRSVMESCDWFRTDLPAGGEWDAWLRILLEGGRAGLVPEPLAVYHQGAPDQLSRRESLPIYERHRVLLGEMRGMYGSKVDDAIGLRLRKIDAQLAVLRGVKALNEGDRIGALQAALSTQVSRTTRLKFLAAAMAPRVAARYLSR